MYLAPLHQQGRLPAGGLSPPRRSAQLAEPFPPRQTQLVATRDHHTPLKSEEPYLRFRHMGCRVPVECPDEGHAAKGRDRFQWQLSGLMVRAGFWVCGTSCRINARKKRHLYVSARVGQYHRSTPLGQQAMHRSIEMRTRRRFTGCCLFLSRLGI